MTDLRTTQVAVEQWASVIPPQAQATQVAIEHWATIRIVNVRLGGQSMLSTAIGLVMVSE
jgi:phosphoribosylformylglycinamidine (FGAM) synthase PurS component